MTNSVSIIDSSSRSFADNLSSTGVDESINDSRFSHDSATSTPDVQFADNDNDTNRAGEQSQSSQSQSLQRLVDALDQLELKRDRRRLRPPWRDPNSQLLNSDRIASFYALLEDFNRTHNTPSKSGSLNLPQGGGDIAVYRPYHATLNRLREQAKIQEKNLILAKRLSQIRPTPGMTRREQMQSHRHYFIPSNLLHQSCGMQHFRLASAPGSRSSSLMSTPTDSLPLPNRGSRNYHRGHSKAANKFKSTDHSSHHGSSQTLSPTSAGSRVRRATANSRTSITRIGSSTSTIPSPSPLFDDNGETKDAATVQQNQLIKTTGCLPW